MISRILSEMIGVGFNNIRGAFKTSRAGINKMKQGRYKGQGTHNDWVDDRFNESIADISKKYSGPNAAILKGARTIDYVAEKTSDAAIHSIGNMFNHISVEAGYMTGKAIRGTAKLGGKAFMLGAKTAGKAAVKMAPGVAKGTLKGGWAGTKLGARVGGDFAMGAAGAAGVAGRAGYDVGKAAWKTRHSAVVQGSIAAIGIGVVIPNAFAAGQSKADHQAKLGAVTYSQGGGEVFNQRTARRKNVDDINASGDLVFAMHNLRHGG